MWYVINDKMNEFFSTPIIKEDQAVLIHVEWLMYI